MNKRVIVLSILALGVVYAFGRYSAPNKVEIHEVEKVVYQEKLVQDKSVNKRSTTTVTEHPDGTKITTTTTEASRDTHTQRDTDLAKDTEKTRIETRNLGMRFELLGGLDVTRPMDGYIVGAHVSTTLIGPLNIGVWALSNKTAGISAGLQF
jgi:hypothetical protein